MQQVFQNKIVQARVLQIKENALGEKSYYVHFLDFEKRMDKWIDQSVVKKVFSNTNLKVYLFDLEFQFQIQ